MATTSLAWQLEKLGKIETCAPNVPFLVEDANTVWVVQSGKLDLFVVATRNGALYGARHHVLRVEEGSAVFGVGGHLKEAALAASAAPGTNVLVVPLEQFLKLSLGEEGSPLRLIEDWVGGLTRALSEDVVREAFLTLEPGHATTVPEEQKAVVPKEGVVWVQHRKGTSRFLGQDDLPAIGSNGFFPVTRYGWLQAAPTSELYSVDSRMLWDLRATTNLLHEFHAIAMLYLDARSRRAASKERELAQARKASDTSLLQTALLRLSSPIRKIQDLRDGEDTCQHPVFLACEVIGKRLNIKMKPHPDMLRGLNLPDAVAGVARASGIRVRNVALKGERWVRDHGPFLAFLQQGDKPVALLPRSARSYEYYDPVANLRVPVNREVAATLRPFAAALYRPFPGKALNAVDLLRFGLLGCNRDLAMILLMGIAAGLMGIVSPFVTGIIFDQLIPGAERTQLVGMSIFLLVIAVSTALFTFARSC